ncbi:MAG: UTP--glucose-1-phosphate uridylyltransferase GalU [Candidatus Cryosericum sp.]
MSRHAAVVVEKNVVIHKAVIPVAGMGTRLLPLTKSQPKEMLPVVDKPAIQYVVEEAIDAGVQSVLMVTGRGKRAIEDYFDHSVELEHELEAHGKLDDLHAIQRISNLIQVYYVRQKLPRGLGDAILQARAYVDGDAFAVLLADDIIDGPTPCLVQMEEVAHRFPGIVVAVMQVPRQDTSSYGIIEGTVVAPGVWDVSRLVEKPDPAEAPSNLAIVGRYILVPGIFDAIEHTEPGRNGEVQLTDAIQAMLPKTKVYACEFKGIRYDIGNQMGLLKANIALALERPELAGELREFLSETLETLFD